MDWSCLRGCKHQPVTNPCDVVTAVTFLASVRNAHLAEQNIFLMIPFHDLDWKVLMPTVQTGTATSFKNILFLTDFSQASAGAMAYSLAFARHFKARLFPAHVMDPVLPESGAVPSEQAVKEEEQKQRQLSRM